MWRYSTESCAHKKGNATSANQFFVRTIARQEFREKTHLFLSHVRAPKLDPFPRTRPPFSSLVAAHQLPESVVVSRKEGTALVDVEEVLERGVRDRKAVERGRSSSELVEQHLGEEREHNEMTTRREGDALGIAW